jgi:hypothetical protein
MHHRRRTTSAALLLQAVIGLVALPLAHARLVDRGAAAEVRVTAPGSDTHLPSHHEANCPVSTLARAAGPCPSHPVVPVVTRDVSAIAPASETRVPAAIRFAPLGGRAPPLG